MLLNLNRLSSEMMDQSVLIKDIRPGMKNMNVTFIVLEVGHPTLLKENREVRTLKVADSTACINLPLWDEPGSLLQPGDIVRLSKCYASIWRHCLTLYCAKAGDIEKIGEFTMVFNEQVNMSEPNLNLVNQISNNQSNSGIGNIVNNVNNGGTNNIGRTSNPPSLTVSSMGKNAPRYSGDNVSTSNKHTAKTNQRGSSRGGQRNAVRSERR